MNPEQNNSFFYLKAGVTNEFTATINPIQTLALINLGAAESVTNVHHRQTILKQYEFLKKKLKQIAS